MELKKILVTGSDGYIGAVLMPKLISKGYEVCGMDSCYFKKSTVGKPIVGFKTIKKDIRKIEKSDLKGIDAVIHLAGLSNDPMGEINPSLTEEINYKATVRLAKLAKSAGVKRFIFSSSCSIYGIKTGTVSEKTVPSPITAYAKSKILSEEALKKIADDNYCICLLRNSTVYGFSPKLRVDLVVNDFVSSAIAKGEISILSDGTPWRPLIDVRDLSDVFIGFLKADSEKINGKVINVGFNNSNFQVKKVLRIVRKQIPSCRIIYAKKHGKDARSYKVNFSLFRKTFPDIKQEWPLEKSVADLAKRLKSLKFGESDISSGKYVRLSILKELMLDKKLDRNLFWNNE